MRATFGDNFTINGRRVCPRTLLTSSLNRSGSLPNTIPPRSVLGHDTFSS
jgi:hypothetical protein